MDHNNKYDVYITELTNLDAEFKNFIQLNNSCDIATMQKFPFDSVLNVNPNIYDRASSLLFGTSTDKYVEFRNGRPYYFVTYHMIVNIGSSKDMNINIGLIDTSESDKILTDQINFYSDYFIHHPSKISKKSDECLGIRTACYKSLFIDQGIWCTNCFSDFYSAHKLKLIIHNEMKFTNIPTHSILYIGKDIERIDENKPGSIPDINKFLDKDKQRVGILQSSINHTENKIKTITERLSAIRDYNQNTLDKMLSIRGGTLEKYLDMIKEYDDKINLVN